MSGAGLSSKALQSGATALGISLTSRQSEQLLALAAELARWNKAYNLTAIVQPEEVLTQHLLDSLSAHDELAGGRIADVGTGAGFPGLPLAIVNTHRQFVLIDAVDKKLRFIGHVARELELANVTTRHARVEVPEASAAAGVFFDTVIARAFAPLPRLVTLIAPLVEARTRVVAMKGRWPPEAGSEDAGPLPSPWVIESLRRVEVPGLKAERHLLRLARQAPNPP